MSAVNAKECCNSKHQELLKMTNSLVSASIKLNSVPLVPVTYFYCVLFTVTEWLTVYKFFFMHEMNQSLEINYFSQIFTYIIRRLNIQNLRWEFSRFLNLRLPFAIIRTLKLTWMILPQLQREKEQPVMLDMRLNITVALGK